MAPAASAPKTTNTITTPIKIFTSALAPEEAGGGTCAGAEYAAGGTPATGGAAPGDVGAAPFACATSPTRVPHLTQKACPSPNAVPQFLQKPAINPPSIHTVDLAQILAA